MKDSMQYAAPAATGKTRAITGLVVVSFLSIINNARKYIMKKIYAALLCSTMLFGIAGTNAADAMNNGTMTKDGMTKK